MASCTPDLATLTPEERSLLGAILDRLFPKDSRSPGAVALGALAYIDRALGGVHAGHRETYRRGLIAIAAAARRRHGRAFEACAPAEQDALIAELSEGRLHGAEAFDQPGFFALLRAHLQEGLFADPSHGGNRDKGGWRFLRHPGVWMENSHEEQMSPRLADKGGEIRSLEEAGFDPSGLRPAEVPGFDPWRGYAEPAEDVDVILVGVGAIGGMIAPILTRAGLRVVGFEAGPYRGAADYAPDELTSHFACRGKMGDPKFNHEVPRWRRSEGEESRPGTVSLGRMVNGVGGSVVYYAGWLRRCHPHHFHLRSHYERKWGAAAIPADSTLADWPIGYDELEPYYTEIEHRIGIAGEPNPYSPRSKPYPMPPLRPFRMGEMFREAAERLGYHPYMCPVGANSVPYGGRAAHSYTTFDVGFGSFNDARWSPAQTEVPAALATGNFDLRTYCRVTRVLTDAAGHANGVEYIDAAGRRRVQTARTVILCAYSLETVRLLLLSANERRRTGLGNAAGHVGRHITGKMYVDVFSEMPGETLNRHTSPAAQALVLDDFLSADFDPGEPRFLLGATLNCEGQALPLMVSREPLPPGVRSWGQPYKDHLAGWHSYPVLRYQYETLPYRQNYAELDPDHRDTTAGLPRLRLTFDLHENERRLAAYVEARAGDILREMGGTRVWSGPRFSGVCTAHDLGGARMGVDPAVSVVDPTLRVHDTPGLYVFGGAVFPSNPGLNPTLTMWAVCCRAAEQLVARLKGGEEHRGEAGRERVVA